MDYRQLNELRSLGVTHQASKPPDFDILGVKEFAAINGMPLGSLRPAIGFYAVPLSWGAGFTWTLSSWLGVFLHRLEAEYGPRDKNYTPLGLEFSDRGPMIWFPHGRAYFTIMLSSDAAHEPKRAVWQLAHEAVHVLSTTGGDDAPLVEEGLACIFADRVSVEQQLGFETTEPSYVAAVEATREWLACFPSAIKETRALEPCFALWTPKLLQKTCPEISAAMAETLCGRFDRNGVVPVR